MNPPFEKNMSQSTSQTYSYPRSILITSSTEDSILLGYDFASLDIQFTTLLKERSAFTFKGIQ